MRFYLVVLVQQQVVLFAPYMMIGESKYLREIKNKRKKETIYITREVLYAKNKLYSCKEEMAGKKASCELL